MKTLHNILVPTDFFEGFELALDYAISMTKLTGATLHIIHVVEPSLYPADLGFSNISFVDIESDLVKTSEEELKKIALNLSKESINFKTSILFGRASDQIVNYATENDIDLICITTQGRNNFDRFIFGSTAEKVIRRATCPVLSIRIPE